jgi:4,5-dihydroxyphthalate decarboxylase
MKESMQMERLTVTLGCQSYDRIRPIMDGQVRIEGCETIVLPMKPDECFYRAFSNAEFEISELSASSYVAAVERGGFPYVAVPVFPSRMFRHSSIYIRRDSGIKEPADLRGRQVGIPEYQMTVGLWARGLLSDLYDIKPHDMKWRTGGLEMPGRKEKQALKLPASIDVQSIPADKTLNEMLVEGRIDALISAIRPSCWGNKNVVRLFPDYRRAEREYFRDTGIFPIMHILGVRKDMAEKHAWLPASVYKAFDESKALCMIALEEFGTLAVTLPWLIPELEETKELMGENFWPYGIEENRKSLETLTRYVHEQGLTTRQVSVDELFARGTLTRVNF